MKAAVILGTLTLATLAAGETPDQPQLPKILHGVGIEQRLNAQVPLEAEFRDEAGRTVPLRRYFGSRPAIVAMVYYRCTMLCNYILNGVVSGLRPLSLRPGRDFDVIAISMDPSEEPPLARAKRDHYANSYSSRYGTDGWHFLTGDEENVRAVADALGFHYRYDPKTKIFLHASGVMVLTPDGRVSRYFYGVEYTPKDLKLGLIEASGRRIGSPADEILLYCYHYDPATGKYGAVVTNMLRICAAAVLLILLVSLTLLWRRDLRRDRMVTREARLL